MSESGVVATVERDLPSELRNMDEYLNPASSGGSELAEAAAVEIERLRRELAAFDRPAAFIEAPCRMSKEDAAAFQREWKKALGDRYRPICLHDGFRIANQQAWRPESIDIQCGNISIVADQRCNGMVTIDGQELMRVRRISVELVVNERPKVQIEFVPQFIENAVETKDDTRLTETQPNPA